MRGPGQSEEKVRVVKHEHRGGDEQERDDRVLHDRRRRLARPFGEPRIEDERDDDRDEAECGEQALDTAAVDGKPDEIRPFQDGRVHGHGRHEDGQPEEHPAAKCRRANDKRAAPRWRR